MMKTTHAKQEEVIRDWYLVDAENKILGRLACEIAHRLRGKHKAIFAPYMDTGDFVVVINADKVKIAVKREEMKTYFHHTGYPGGLKERAYKELTVKKPEWVIETAVRGMLPKTRLGRQIFKKLKVYRGTEHPHTAQKPEVLSF